jgi:hypothetical protein
MENEEALEAGAAICHTADLVENLINQFLSDRVVTTGVVVGCILLSGNHVLGVEEASVCAGPDLIDNVGLQIAVDGARNVFALAGLGEERAEAMVVLGGFALLGEVAIGLNAMLEAVELPAGVCNLATSLANVQTDNLSHIDDETAVLILELGCGLWKIDVGGLGREGGREKRRGC